MSTAFFYPTCTKIWRCHGKLEAERGTFTWFYFKGQDWTLYWTEVVYMNSVHDNTNQPKNKCRWRNSLMWFIFNLQRRKIHTLVHNYVQYLCVDSLACKKSVPYLGWWPSVHDANLTPLWSHVENRLPISHKPLASPLPQVCPFFNPTCSLM